MTKQISLSETQLRNTIYKTIASMLKEEIDLSVLHPNQVSNYVFSYMSRTMGNSTMHIDNPLKLKNLGFLKNVDYWDVTSGNNTSEVSNLVAWGGEGGYWFNVLNNPKTPEPVKQKILSRKKDWANNTLEEAKDMSKKVIKINESVLRDMISEAIESIVSEAFNTGQYAFMAGRANGMLDNNKMKRFTDPKWYARKQRQAQLFGNAAAGHARDANYSDGGREGSIAKVDNSNYDIDYVSNQYNPNAKNGDFNRFQMQRSQMNQGTRLSNGDYLQGKKGENNGQTYTYDQARGGAIKDYNRDSVDTGNLRRNNTYLNHNYNNGLQSAGKNGQQYAQRYNGIQNYENLEENVNLKDIEKIISECIKNVLQNLDEK